MIPKIIHYCWFGYNEMSELHKKCIESWKNVLYDYKFILWNENSFDIDSCVYTKEAYQAKKYAYVSDYVRLYALNKCGGIYLDTDVFVVKSFNSLLNLNGFLCYENEKDKIPATCVIGANKENKLISFFLDYYKDKSFINEYGYYDLIPNTVVLSKILRKYSRDFSNTDITILSTDYFSPKLYNGEPQKTNNTYSIHYFDGSWTKNKDAAEIEMDIALSKYTRILGNKMGCFFYRNVQRIKKMGVIGWIKFLRSRKI